MGKDEWEVLPNLINSRYMKRIVDCNGSRVQPAWSEFESQVKGKLVVWKGHDCMKQTGGTCYIGICYGWRNGAYCSYPNCVCPVGACVQGGEYFANCTKVTGDQCY